MIYTKEVENMCIVGRDANHGPSPIPEEGKWVQAKEVSDISGYSSNPGDYLSLSISGDIGESVNLYAEFAKENFTASFSDTEDYFTRDAVFAVGADFTFGNAAFGAEFRSIFTDSVSEYVNVPSYSGLADTELAIKARLFF